jgi:hypothetical protein
MKQTIWASLIFLSVFGITEQASAQIPGAILSAGVLGGVQTSSINGMAGGNYWAVRGSFSSLFGELRYATWGDGTTYVHESGFLAGMDMALWHIMVSGAVGLGSSTYQAPPVLGQTLPTISYTSFLYEAQAIYQFEIISGILTAGIGVNYLGESNIGSAVGIPSISGVGGVAMISIGI